jgi:putative endonuclease
MERGGIVYIMTNKIKTTLYVGVTADLYSRIMEHKQHIYKKSFTDKYNLEHCVYYESLSTIEEAIAREKQIKKYRREKKELLINSINPEWKDLWEAKEQPGEHKKTYFHSRNFSGEESGYFLTLHLSVLQSFDRLEGAFLKSA